MIKLYNAKIIHKSKLCNSGKKDFLQIKIQETKILQSSCLPRPNTCADVFPRRWPHPARRRWWPPSSTLSSFLWRLPNSRNGGPWVPFWSSGTGRGRGCPADGAILPQRVLLNTPRRWRWCVAAHCQDEDAKCCWSLSWRVSLCFGDFSGLPSILTFRRRSEFNISLTFFTFW